ncbi:DUF5983 family protein, partial [Klebsiella pneumoniae]|uniref:DUF5983 family protein n=1 Tax=Klebsiella pneumoniae TaxID=573 RepID=UPI001F2524AF
HGNICGSGPVMGKVITGVWKYRGKSIHLKRLGLSKTFRRLVVTLIRRYGVSLIHLDASAGCLPDLPTFDW